jgi:dihydroceramide fatty acyl 2-hydroxylase
MVERAALFLFGIFIWTFLEYVVHAWLSHTFQTFAQPLHQVHHNDPRAVFTIGAWVPVAATWIGLLAAFGCAPGVILLTGIVTGFIGYEVLHYRLHFQVPASSVERYLRLRHLFHHERQPNQCFGVTSPFWDLAFGTEATGDLLEQYALTEVKPPLTGATNLYKLRAYLPHFRTIGL